jgi:hypothetical protein
MINNTAKDITVAVQRTSMSLYLGCGVLMVAILLADLTVPLGVARGRSYIAAVLLSFWSPEKRFTIFVAVICSFLTVIASVYKPSAGELRKVLSNRALALLAIWVTATLTLQRKQIEDKREKAVRDCEKALEEIKVLRGFLTSMNGAIFGRSGKLGGG